MNYPFVLKISPCLMFTLILCIFKDNTILCLVIFNNKRNNNNKQKCAQNQYRLDYPVIFAPNVIK